MRWKDLFRTQSITQIQKEIRFQEENGIKDPEKKLNRTLSVWDLTSFGVAAVVGAGIFSTIGNAVSEGGPAVVLLFVFTAVVCGFSALCYAEFASRLPIAGSAYTYAYVSFGELFAWIIGWDLLMEYAISNIAVAISWSEYFASLLAGYGVRIPSYLSIDFLSAYRGYEQLHGESVTQGVSPALWVAYDAWIHAPRFLGLPIICNLPALGITFIVTAVAFVGIQESKIASNLFVLLKVMVILLVVVLGSFYVHPVNWTPFAPHGIPGVFKGISAVFFAYIGFDAISTTAEECKNPQRDLPRGMIYSLLICTLLYVLVSVVLTGMVRSDRLAVGDPLAFVFGPEGANIPWVAGLISASAVVSLFTVLLVYQLGQPRIWMAMSRDGLLPPIFSVIHPRFKTPWISTILTGLLVAIPSLFLNLTEVTNLASIGTLFAFALVCGGVLTLDSHPRGKKGFRIPYINSKFIFPSLVVLSVFIFCQFSESGLRSLITGPMAVFSVLILILSVLCFRKNLSLIPVLGLATCSYLITEMGLTNWLRFGIWLLIGLGIYFLYGVRNSKLRKLAEGSVELV